MTTTAPDAGWDRARVADVALAGAIAVAGFVLDVSTDPLQAAVVGVVAVPLAWRRTHPLPSAAATAGLLGVVLVLVPPDVGHPLVLMAVALIAAYSVAAHETRRPRALLGGVLVAVGMTADILLRGPGATDDAMWPFRALEAAVAWLVGRAMYRRGRQVREIDRHARRLVEEQERRTAAAVAEERSRLARELHDVVAHNVSLIVVQAGAAEQVLRDTPERALEALVTIQAIGRQTVDELRRLLGILRDEDAAALRGPQPTLADLDALVEQVRRSGTEVAVERDDDLDVPASIDLSAYRILQEGLTNVIKHAGAARAHVLVRRERDGLLVEVSDDGRGSSGQRSDGLGLVGMAERVALLGGAFETCDRPEGGFRLRAWLPIGSVVP